MINRFSNLHLQIAVELLDKINAELLEVRKTVIDLQAKVIEKRDEELSLLRAAVKDKFKSVQGVVETGMKAFRKAISRLKLTLVQLL